MESINAASVLLRRKHEDHMSLLAEVRLHMKIKITCKELLTQPLSRKSQNVPSFLHGKLRKAQELVQRINPVLHQLHQRTTTAVEHSEQHLAMRDRAMEERNLVRHLPLK